VEIWEGNRERGQRRFGISAVSARETAERPELLALVAWNAASANLWDGEPATRVEVASIAGDLPAVLGHPAALRRWLTAEDAAAARRPPAPSRARAATPGCAGGGTGGPRLRWWSSPCFSARPWRSS